MSLLDALRDLTDAAAQMIDWQQGYDVANPLEELGGAITRARAAIAFAELREWHPAGVFGFEERLDEAGNRWVRSVKR